MKIIRTIKVTPDAPDTNSLWLNKEKAKYFNNGKWTDVGGVDMDLFAKVAFSGDYKDLLNTPDSAYIFKISDNIDDKQSNLKLASDILFDKTVEVGVVGTINNTLYNTRGVYCDGYITVLQDTKQVVFNVSFNDGSITIKSLFDLSTFMPYIDLKIGDSSEVKSENLEKLTLGHFFTSIDYGYGVGTFNPSDGGRATITTADGHEVFYNIGADGSVTVDSDYIHPDEPYRVIIDSAQIGSPVNDITASKIIKCGELLVTGSTGPITYTRSVDSTASSIFFISDKKDGTMQVLTYTVSNKTFTSSIAKPIINSATTTEVGGVLKATAVADLAAEAALTDVVGKVNELLASLRTSGVITV